MTHCQPAARDRVRAAARQLADHQAVIEPDVIPPAESRRDAWTLAAIVRGRSAPPAVLDALADHRLDYHPEPPQGAFCSLCATAPNR